MLRAGFFRVGLGLLLLGTLMAAGARAGEEATGQPTSSIALRHLHEGSLFLLQHYAILEALISAEDLGRSENQSFLIGTTSLIPGTGQMINGDYLQGSLLLFASTLSLVSVHHLGVSRKPKLIHEELLPAYYAATLLQNGLVTYAMLHAANASYREHRDRTAAMWTGTASLLPGAGQAINGDWWEAAGFLTSWIAASLLTAGLEQAMLAPGEDKSLAARNPTEPAWSFALLPAGAAVAYSQRW